MATLDVAASTMQLLGEPTRVRLLSLLAGRELTVAELTSVTELSQSRVSTHLGKLREAGVIRDRRAGVSTYYSLNEGEMPKPAKKVWELIFAELDDDVLAADKTRLDAVIRARHKEGWPEAFAGQMEKHYSPGRTWEATTYALSGLLELGDVLDVGSGDGTIAELVAPHAKSVVCVDKSAPMIEAATSRLASFNHARCVVANADELPFLQSTFDQVLLLNVLTHAERPEAVIAELARVLRKGGRLTVVTLNAHKHAAIAEAYKHVHLGFSPEKLERMLKKTGLVITSCGITSREKRPPFFEIVTAVARKRPARSIQS